MRYTPYEQEYVEAATLDDSQRLEYFLTRVFETEEVWGLDDGAEWVMRDRQPAEKSLLVWPYQKYAVEAAEGPWRDLEAQAESLECFISNTLEMLIDENAVIEIMGQENELGCIISPHRLLSILAGMIDAGEYTLDG